MAKAIANILSNIPDTIKKGAEALGAVLPKLILATMKFFGGGRRANF